MNDRRVFERYRPLVDDWSAFLEALERPLSPCIWTNTLREEPAELAALLESEGVSPAPVGWYRGAFRLPRGSRPGKLWPLIAGLYHIQEEIALLPVVLLDPQPAERVLDLCASPGNKTAQIAVAMGNSGTVVANDIRIGRLSALRNTIERLGLVCVSTTHQDGTGYPPASGPFDRVLVDAPCSCEGTSRKNPRIVERIASGGWLKKVSTQQALLEKAVLLARPGGRIVYSTCTYAPEENELVVDAVLRRFGPSGLRLLPAAVEGVRTASGVTEWEGRKLDPSLSRSLRLWPHLNDTGGFFVAVLENGTETHRGSVRAARRPFPASSGTRVEPEPRALDDGEDGEPVLTLAIDRFGIPPSVLAGLRVFRGKTRGLYAVNREHRPPRSPTPDASGVFLLKTGMRYPKLTTAGALLWGREATRNVLELERGELEDYIAHRSLSVSEERILGSSGRGYLLVRHRGRPLGLAFYRLEAGSSSGVVESYFPKGWSWGFGTETR